MGEPTIADAILDRIVHDAHRIEMKGESLRKKKKPLELLMYLKKTNLADTLKTCIDYEK